MEFTLEPTPNINETEKDTQAELEAETEKEQKEQRETVKDKEPAIQNIDKDQVIEEKIKNETTTATTTTTTTIIKTNKINIETDKNKENNNNSKSWNPIITNIAEKLAQLRKEYLIENHNSLSNLNSPTNNGINDMSNNSTFNFDSITKDELLLSSLNELFNIIQNEVMEHELLAHHSSPSGDFGSSPIFSSAASDTGIIKSKHKGRIAVNKIRHRLKNPESLRMSQSLHSLASMRSNSGGSSDNGNNNGNNNGGQWSPRSAGGGLGSWRSKARSKTIADDAIYTSMSRMNRMNRNVNKNRMDGIIGGGNGNGNVNIINDVTINGVSRTKARKVAMFDDMQESHSHKGSDGTDFDEYGYPYPCGYSNGNGNNNVFADFDFVASSPNIGLRISHQLDKSDKHSIDTSNSDVQINVTTSGNLNNSNIHDDDDVDNDENGSLLSSQHSYGIRNSITEDSPEAKKYSKINYNLDKSNSNMAHNNNNRNTKPQALLRKQQTVPIVPNSHSHNHDDIRPPLTRSTSATTKFMSKNGLKWERSIHGHNVTFPQRSFNTTDETIKLPHNRGLGTIGVAFMYNLVDYPHVMKKYAISSKNYRTFSWVVTVHEYSNISRIGFAYGPLAQSIQDWNHWLSGKNPHLQYSLGLSQDSSRLYALPQKKTWDLNQVMRDATISDSKENKNKNNKNKNECGGIVGIGGSSLITSFNVRGRKKIKCGLDDKFLFRVDFDAATVELFYNGMFIDTIWNNIDTTKEIIPAVSNFMRAAEYTIKFIGCHLRRVNK